MRKLLAVTILILLPTLALAQADADINLFIGAPQGDFQDNLGDRVAVGINGSIAFAPALSPIQIGLEMGIMTYGNDTRRESFNPNIPEVQVRVETSYDIFTGHLFLRYEAPVPVVRPYIDGLVGFNYLFTQTKIQDSQDYDEIASDTNFDDFAFSYGVGGGVKFKVFESPVNRIYINLKTRYLFGSEASYLQPGSIEVNNGELTFNESTSNTNMLTFHLGAAFKF